MLPLAALMRRPVPVEGLESGQRPAPGKRVRRDGTLTVQVSHPPEPGSWQPPARAAGLLPELTRQLPTQYQRSGCGFISKSVSAGSCRFGIIHSR